MICAINCGLQQNNKAKNLKLGL